VFTNVTIPPRPTTPKPTFPRATVHRVQPGMWATNDGYQIRKHVKTYELSPDCEEFHVYVPGGTRPRAVVDYMREAREVICALRKSDNQCGHPHLV
jgi:hypothetical protein